jgi:hypothetical protein
LFLKCTLKTPNEEKFRGDFFTLFHFFSKMHPNLFGSWKQTIKPENPSHH